MKKSLYRLITGCISGLAAIAEAVVVYLGTKGFEYSVQCATAIPIATGAIDQILLLLVKDEPNKLEKK